MSTNFCLRLTEPSAREVLIFWFLIEREEQRASKRKKRRTWLKPTEDRNSITAEKTVGP